MVRSLWLLPLLLLAPASPLAAADPPPAALPQEDGDQECRTAAVVWPPADSAWHLVRPGETLLLSETREECLWAVPKADARVSEYGTYLRKGTLLWNAGPGRFCHREEGTRFCVLDKNGDGRFDRSTTLGGGKGVNLTTPYDSVWISTGPGTDRRELVLLEVAPDGIRASLRDGSGSSELRFDLGAAVGEVAAGGLEASVRRAEGGVEVRSPGQ